MAEMIPDRLPQGASAGEKRVFDALQRLPDDCVVYYEPVVRARYPDFVVIMPDVGLLVIEAKGWYPSYIQRADINEIAIKAPNQDQTIERHPLKQAREYMFALMDVARRHPASAKLIHVDGQQAGRFVFPFGTLAVLNNIARDQLDVAFGDMANAIFPHPRVMTRDELLLLETLNPVKLRERLRECFDPWWKFAPLTDHQMAAVRAIIHPEIVLPPKVSVATESETLFVLDYRQERFARSIGDGHRVLYGVAGSGKTVILLSRARLLAEDPSKRILLLCYNKSLASYFRSALADVPQVTALHFHGWGSRNKVSFDKDEEEEDYGLRFLDRLQDQAGDAGAFDAVLIDESQDFARSWFECAREALKDPNDGDLVIVGDGNQSLYRRRRFTWRDAGIKAVGARTINVIFDLNRNYRNTREILRWALPFATNPTSQTEDSTLLAVPINPNTALRSGPPPRLIKCANRQDECAWVTKEVRDWLSNGIPAASGEREPIQPSQIGVLYPALRWQDRSIMNNFLYELRAIAPVVWFNQPGGADIGHPGIKVQTIRSSKGLQYKAVIVIWADLLPFNDDPEEIALDRGQLYVGMTRAEDFLTVTCASSSAFTEELERALQT